MSLKKLKELNPYLYKLIKNPRSSIKRYPDMIKNIAAKYVAMMEKRK